MGWAGPGWAGLGRLVLTKLAAAAVVPVLADILNRYEAFRPEPVKT